MDVPNQTFENRTAISIEKSSVVQMVNPDIINPASIQIQYSTSLVKPKGIRLRKYMIFLIMVEIPLSLLSIALGSACVGIDFSKHFSICEEGSAIWVGILCIITTAIGFCALNSPTGHRYSMMAYFVLSIISSVGCCVLLVFSSFWLSDSLGYYSYSMHMITDVYWATTSGDILALVVLNAVLVVVSIIHCKF